ncbi:hypothetical protein BABINDRAFT_161930 [Babjeviella inositovora NRRL Y-12698]|uniref:Yippee domain-containing protein n=1 Tax=Babjeviella inositovora NRRL Y-12698 TaxID=984486 RepID=A0A1E3QPG5_9ASCO|nr:uncharacterized protein BABINDRAFT_161930 [Babjeviella inositovora NRRL Y-12698]ODQ79540.1 hypothetical protein BABINDRAFT_161930 [Babjeviella inositovora NRRL Y-12698]
MGIPYQEFYRLTPKRHKLYRCSTCHADLLLPSHIISDNFQGDHGKGFLVDFKKLLNVEVIPPHLLCQSKRRGSVNNEPSTSACEADVLSDASDSDDGVCHWGNGIKEVKMTTGTYLITDIECALCKTKIGWKYLRAVNNPDNLYKEGKCLVERALIELVDGLSDCSATPRKIDDEADFIKAEMAKARARLSISTGTGYWMDVERRHGSGSIAVPSFTSHEVSGSFIQIVNLGFPTRRHGLSRAERIRNFLEYTERGPVRFEE